MKSRHFKTRTQTQSLVYNDDYELELRRILRNQHQKKGANGGKDFPSLPAVAFDIDGVFKMGGKYASFGAEALRKVIDAGLPYVLMTNGGGGRTEAQYAEEVNKKLTHFDDNSNKDDSVETVPYVTEEQMLLSYTPFDKDLDHLKNEPVLIVGSPRIAKAAEHYGFTKAMHLSEYTCRHPLMNPFGTSGCEKDDCVIRTDEEKWDEDFKAILVFTDPENFFEGIQVLTDVLLSSRPGEVEFEKKRRIPIVFSNPDLLWKTQYPYARFGQGAFRLSLEACYRARLEALGCSENEISERLGDFVQYGKPEPSQFLHTRRLLMGQAVKKGCDISHFYMVGDNPASDIQGAVNMNHLSNEESDSRRWSGLLVETGVYTPGDDQKGAHHVSENVLTAVDHVINSHKEEIEAYRERIRQRKRTVTMP
jgi:HAD superfamily hydrolase (TIGR01456 family)